MTCKIRTGGSELSYKLARAMHDIIIILYLCTYVYGHAEVGEVFLFGF